MTTTIPTKRKFGDVNTVTLFAGANRTVFHVHEDILCAASPVFKASFESKFKESTDRTMELPDEDADVVDMFVRWLYRKTIDHDVVEMPAPERQRECLMQDFRLFILAEKYDVRSLQASICEDLFDIATGYQNKVPSFAMLEFVYANTHRKAMIRKFIADWFASTDMSNWQDKEKPTDMISTDWLYQIPEFSVDLALALCNPYGRTGFNSGKSSYMQSLRKKTGWN